MVATLRSILGIPRFHLRVVVSPSDDAARVIPRAPSSMRNPVRTPMMYTETRV
jgi:hypothetical protein